MNRSVCLLIAACLGCEAQSSSEAQHDSPGGTEAGARIDSALPQPDAELAADAAPSVDARRPPDAAPPADAELPSSAPTDPCGPGGFTAGDGCTCVPGYQEFGGRCAPTLASGSGHACHLGGDGTLRCWGAGCYGQIGDGAATDTPVPVPIAGDWATVGANDYVSCAIKHDGTLWCWGMLVSGYPYRMGTHAPTPTQIGSDTDWMLVAPGNGGGGASGGCYSCGLKPSGVWCWYEARPSSADAPSPLLPPQRVIDGSWRMIGVRENLGCGIRDDGTLWCWGSTAATQMGTGRWRDIALGADHRQSMDEEFLVGVDAAGSLWRFDGLQANLRGGGQSPPIRLYADRGWAEVAVLGDTACATRDDGALHCWGANFFGQAGDPSLAPQVGLTELVGTTSWSGIVTGSSHACSAAADGVVRCWGENTSGQLGDGTGGDKLVPVAAEPAERWISVSGIWPRNCAVRADGTLWCFGGQPNPADPSSSPMPTQVGEDTDWVRVVSGTTFRGYEPHVCGLKLDGSLWCWYPSSAPLPARVRGGPWRSAAVGATEICAVADDRTLWCLEQSFNGVLAEPTAQAPGNDWTLVAGTAWHFCSLRLDGSLWCWGSNGNGQLGLAPGYTSENEPLQQVGTDTDWTRVAAGPSTTCAIKIDGSMTCWGRGAASDLGPWAANWIGLDFDCALAPDGRLACRGENLHGQLGDGTRIGRPAYAPVSTAIHFAQAAAGPATCALDVDGKLWCWGEAQSVPDGNAFSAVPRRVAE